MLETFDVGVWLLGLGALLLLMTAVWAISRPLKDVSIVDPVWPLAFLIAHGVYIAVAPGPVGARAWLTFGLIAVWTVRLGGYLTWRKFAEPGEDRRYTAMREKRGPAFATSSLWIVFWLQAALAWFVSLPLLSTSLSTRPLGLLDALGALLFAFGWLFETVGDLQLARFKGDPKNRGKVLRTGLWRWTRHPNYFGNACMWWGVFAIALAGGGWWSFPGPLFMTFLLLQVSGVRLLEADIKERRPEYADYIRRTSAFVPRKPRS